MMEVIARRREPARHLAAAYARLQPVAANGVAKFIVPFHEASGETPELITVVACIPGFCDQAHLREKRILSQRGKECRPRIVAMMQPTQYWREIKTESIDTHFPHPVTQRIEHKLRHARMFDIERIAAPG